MDQAIQYKMVLWLSLPPTLQDLKERQSRSALHIVMKYNASFFGNKKTRKMNTFAHC